ncbi:hypothetical protein [Mucilaginibacter boryungensis]|uniref:Neutral/alkaline non-lysosomal ceramidase N-terminal domain-containing protein n=1 Tax=Mucilaginibacter boryungensis TaxID=768480 RepID=A0ABR9XKK3_9SPHI|nr:hypothetical protein [Mucilaginibacter boryungensis]MBE9667599.1 hypothetical protein [Mucilaginibacter boryungensis]
MIRKFQVVLALLLCSLSATYSQEYLTGSSVVSIEPDSSIYSVAIAGYGAPREGRFSITWKLISDIPETAAITTLNGKLYAAGKDGEIMEGVLLHDHISWKILENKAPVTCLTVLNGKLYAATTTGDLLQGTLSLNGIVWLHIGKSNNITGLTGINGKLYAANSSNGLLTGVIWKNKLTWVNTGQAYRILGMANDGERVYYINSGDTLWFSKPGQPYNQWREIGRHNSFTFNIHIKHILVLNGRLYAVSKDNKLYLAHHSTKGDLTVRSLAVKKGRQTAVITTLDVTGFNYTFIKTIKAEIFKRRGLPEAALLINASHTHFAPVTQAWSAWGDFYHTPDSNYLNRIVKKAVIRSIEQALDNLGPAQISFARGTTNIGENRRGANNLAKPYDKTLDIIKITHPGNGKSEVLFTTGCHPVFNNSEANSTFTLNANYPGVAKRLIQEKTGYKAIFVQGCGGDINPRVLDYESTGKELADDVLNRLNSDMKKVSGDISYSLDEIQIPVKPWSLKKVQDFKAENAAAVIEEKKNTPPYSAEGQFVLTQLLEREKNVRWANIMLDNYKKGTVAKTMPLYVQIINIGPWKLVGLSREVTTEYAEAIRALWPDQLVSVAGYCNDVPSYLPRDWHIHDSTYEGYDSFFWYGQSAVPPANVRDIVLNGIKKLHR